MKRTSKLAFVKLIIYYKIIDNNLRFSGKNCSPNTLCAGTWKKLEKKLKKKNLLQRKRK